MRGVIYAVLVSSTHPLLAVACEPVFEPRSELDSPISVEADGSFEVKDLRSARAQGNGEYYSFRWVRGSRVTDIGGQRVGQKITVDYGCSATEYLLFLDCSTGEGVRIAGEDVPDYNILGAGYSSIGRIQPPNGPIALTATITVGDVVNTAQANGYSYTRDVSADALKMARFQRYDPFFGCKLFYPDSPGAQQ